MTNHAGDARSSPYGVTGTRRCRTPWSGRRAKQVYELVGEASLSKVFARLISVSSLVAPTGFEPVFQP